MPSGKYTVMDMPKLESPFKRKFNEKNEYVCVPEIEEHLQWVFTEESIAVEKLDGTNISVLVEQGTIVGVYNRKNFVDVWGKGNKRFTEGILESIERELLSLKKLNDGQYFGELIGPKINGNPYSLECHIWLPFDYVKENLEFKFWHEFVKELHDLNDAQIYAKMRDTFKGLWSLYKRRHGIKGEVNESTAFEGMAAEGMVFYRKNTGEMAKLRRDMFDFFKGRRHEQVQKSSKNLE